MSSPGVYNAQGTQVPRMPARGCSWDVGILSCDASHRPRGKGQLVFSFPVVC